MIVHDEETLEAALAMLAASGVVRYSDEFSYRTITSPEQLEHLCLAALEEGDVAVVASDIAQMEEHGATLRLVKKRRAQEERRKIREWVKQHPELAKAKAEEIPKLVKQMRKRELRTGSKG